MKIKVSTREVVAMGAAKFEVFMHAAEEVYFEPIDQTHDLICVKRRDTATGSFAMDPNMAFGMAERDVAAHRPARPTPVVKDYRIMVVLRYTDPTPETEVRMLEKVRKEMALQFKDLLADVYLVSAQGGAVVNVAPGEAMYEGQGSALWPGHDGRGPG